MYESYNILRRQMLTSAPQPDDGVPAHEQDGVPAQPLSETEVEAEESRLRLLLEHAVLKERLKGYRQDFEAAHSRRPTSGARVCCLGPTHLLHVPTHTPCGAIVQIYVVDLYGLDIA